MRLRLRDVESDVRDERTDVAVEVTARPYGIYVRFVGFDGKPPGGLPNMPPGVMIQNVHGKIVVGVRSDPDKYAHTHAVKVRKTRPQKKPVWVGRNLLAGTPMVARFQSKSRKARRKG